MIPIIFKYNDKKNEIFFCEDKHRDVIKLAAKYIDLNFNSKENFLIDLRNAGILLHEICKDKSIEEYNLELFNLFGLQNIFSLYDPQAVYEKDKVLHEMNLPKFNKLQHFFEKSNCFYREKDVFNNPFWIIDIPYVEPHNIIQEIIRLAIPHFSFIPNKEAIYFTPC